MRTGYVRKLDNGNWEVVERVGKKLKVLSGAHGIPCQAGATALMQIALEGATLSRRDYLNGTERWYWSVDA